MNYILYKFIDSGLLTIEERIEILDKMKWFYLLSDELKVPTILKSVQYIIESIVNIKEIFNARTQDQYQQNFYA